MGEIIEISDDEDIPMGDGLNYNFPLHTTCSVDVASSSSSNLRSLLLDMGFAPSAVDKAIEENGEEKEELLLEALIASSGHQQVKKEDSFDFDLSSSSSENLTANPNLNEEPDADASSSIHDGKKASLIDMNFSLAEVDFAMDKLGKDAALSQLMDFIFAARMSKKYGKDGDKDCSDEVVFGVTEKTLQLIEMGFTENDISAAFEICGSEASLQELAESIFSLDAQKNRHPKRQIQVPSDSLERTISKMPRTYLPDEPQLMKKPKAECEEDMSTPVGRMRPAARKRMTAWEKMLEEMGRLEEKPTAPSIPNSPIIRTLSSTAAKPPFFLYGNATSLSQASWFSITQFLYSVHPEFVNTDMYSALSRTEGYVHNLPAENRFHITPKGPLTIKDVIPQTKKWWPAWDNRSQLTCINCETSGITHLCEGLGRASASLPEQQSELIQQLQAKNLVWVGHNKLGPLEPGEIEVIMGYPLHHTRVDGLEVQERLKSLKLALQTDTLAYHLSVLKKLYPDGLTMMSCFDGIGGPEVALHRLGVHLKGLVCVEPNEMKRMIVRKWWETSRQRGELVQFESIQELTSSTLEGVLKKFHGFDLIVCQHPYCSEDDSGTMSGLDFSMFAEFVRVLQRARVSR